MRLFKYTNHFGINVLRDLQLKVTPPNELNDPFEFSPYVLPGTITGGHVEELMKTAPAKELYDEMVNAGDPVPPFDVFEKVLRRVPPERIKQAIPLFQKSYEELVADNLNSISKQSGLICFSAQENHILMWSHYTDSHKGMLLEFDTSHQYFEDNLRFLEVTYSETRVPFDPTWPDKSEELAQHCKQVLCTKNSAWDYEGEWRSLFPLHWGMQKPDTRDAQRVLYFTNFPPEIIRRVVLGFRCPVEIERQVREARKKNGMDFSLCRAVLHSREFRVEYRPI
jgi:hypothetical protein